MRKTFILLIMVLVILFTGTGCKKTAYHLVWSDEFDYSGKPDTAKWDYDIGGHGWGNKELQYYTDRLENAKVEDGKLIITARKEVYDSSAYTSAKLVSRKKGDWLYARVEARAKLPSGLGTWPAIWMLPTDWEYGGWPKSGEIDIMEHVGHNQGYIHGTIHTEAFNHSIGTQVGDKVNIQDASAEFHVYAIEWTPKKIDFYIDDNQYFTFLKQGDDHKTWPFDKRFHLIMNIAVGGTWGGQQGVDDSIFPQAMEIDYVHIYQK